ncbi:hypothetical protein [Flavobacterium sp. '19STA2R22 D10 B1']|uniref:hypothetical protein n=1 Tax=Flavobacterium aerium TaxID=3037261 RepID=UPI00278C5059|nr:hypothetical protein [Flavobacterium sp. '19STA2R22 D10 B1']
MKVEFSHIFIQAGIKFNFSYILHNFLSDNVSLLVHPSEMFLKHYEGGYELIFNISAKKELATNEIVGPRTSKKNKKIEFTIFLPYTPIMKELEPNRSALVHLFEGVYEVLGKYEIDTSKLKAEQEKIIDKIMSSPEMFEK